MESIGRCLDDLMHVTYLAHFTMYVYTAYQYILTYTGSPPDYCSGLGSATPATAHAQNVLHSETKSKVRPIRN